MRNLFLCLTGVVLGVLLSACTPMSNPGILAEKRGAVATRPTSKVLIAIDPRFHYQQYANLSALDQYYQHIEERLQTHVAKRGLSVAVAPRTMDAFSPAMNPETLRTSNASHILFITHEGATSNNYGIVNLRWRVSYLQNNAQARGAERDYQPEYQSSFQYFTCMGALPAKPAWEGCADKVADHVIERLISNGIF